MNTISNSTPQTFLYRLKFSYLQIDARYIVTALLLTYNLLGVFLLGFNRSLIQISSTVAVGVLLHMAFDFLFFKKIQFNISSLTTSLGLCILVNYSHSLIFAVVPVFLAISSKYILTYQGKHKFNPAMFGVTSSLLIAPDFISAAPAYQWNDFGAMAFFIVLPALILFMPKINRHYLVGSFLLTFCIQITLRSILMKHYLPFETLFFGTITSPAFFLFVFFMITDPGTSPQDKKDQIVVGVSLAIVDLIYHLFSSYHTFFYAALTVATVRFINLHLKSMWKSGNPFRYFWNNFYRTKYYHKFFTIIFISSLFVFSTGLFGNHSMSKSELDFQFEKVSEDQSGFKFKLGEILNEVDPRVQHMGKWFLAITDGVAVGDFDNDGLLDLFFTNGHKSKEDRNALFKNLGEFRFQRIPSEELSHVSSNFKTFGVPSNAMFVDFNNDGFLDLYVTYAFGDKGYSRMFCNQLPKLQSVKFVDCTEYVGLKIFSNSATANFFDFNNDGLLDLILGNTIATHLSDYDQKTPFNLFNLPKPEFNGDRRMFNFMHESWHKAENGGLNYLYIQNPNHTFWQLDSTAIGLPETKWSMSIATADFNHDGFIDLYVANDFGADDLYYNSHGKHFQKIEGEMFGDISKDTYKGMNATVADFDENGFVDVHVSNVHHQLQAEGNLLWYFYPNPKDKNRPFIKDRATFSGALNENRFGWGAGVADFNNDGRVDLIQANGMVDNIIDRKKDQTEHDCPDYWYVNEKIARSSPDIHKYIDNWGDIRGKCIYGFEQNRLYINRGVESKPQFVDVADQVGMIDKANFRGMAVADFNNDGAMDFIASSLYRNPYVYKNHLGSRLQKNHWYGVTFISEVPNCNRQAIGSKVYIHTLDKNRHKKIQYFETTLVNGFSAQSDPRLHFALKEGHTFLKMHVLWCGKISQTYESLLPNQYQTLRLRR